MSGLFSGGRGVTIGRVAVVFFVVLAVFLFRDSWLPSAEPAYQDYSPVPPPPSIPDSKDSPANDLTAPPAGNPPSPPPPPPQAPQPHADDAITSQNDTCLHLPGADKVLVMLKTGATELYQKLPTHFVTTFTCIPNYMIFSDLEQHFGGVKIHDAIAPVSKKYRDEHKDFQLYREIEKWQREGQDLGKLKGDTGWNLDKWKFLPMFHMAFDQAADDIEWFVMMEADTSISWLNLLLYLKTMDPTKPYYIGAQNVIGETTFAHGGSGIVMSRKAADILEAARLNAGKEHYDEAWEEQTAQSCCGDEIVARAFLAVDIPLTPGWPLIQGETISTVDFTSNHWCTPPITFHHVTPIEVDNYWQFEKDWTDKRGWKEPYLYRDIFAHFLEHHISINRTKWNNLSKDQKYVTPALASPDDKEFSKLEKYQQDAVETEEACAAACIQAGDQCIQWMFQPGRCYLGRDIRFGKSDEREGDHWNCGWIQERVEKFKKSQEGCSIRWAG